MPRCLARLPTHVLLLARLQAVAVTLGAGAGVGAGAGWGAAGGGAGGARSRGGFMEALLAVA